MTRAVERDESPCIHNVCNAVLLAPVVTALRDSPVDRQSNLGLEGRTCVR